MHTIEKAKNWALENRILLDNSRMECKDKNVQMLNKMIPVKAKELWDSGCWLEVQLQACEATKEQVREIQEAHGQRSFARDCWEVAIKYANEFKENGNIKEKSGLELAKKINHEMISLN